MPWAVRSSGIVKLAKVAVEDVVTGSGVFAGSRIAGTREILTSMTLVTEKAVAGEAIDALTTIRSV